MYAFHMAARPLVLTGGLLLAGLGLMFCSTTPAAAQRKPESQKVSNSQLHFAIVELRATKKELEAADHDYGGHRADAVKAIGAAIHQLHEALQYETGKGAGASGGKHVAPLPSGDETQRVSNRHLRHAIVVLRATKAELEAADHDYGGHRADAVKAVTHAMHQLEAALQYVKNKQ